jgi:hypothetical protein
LAARRTAQAGQQEAPQGRVAAKPAIDSSHVAKVLAHLLSRAFP